MFEDVSQKLSLEEIILYNNFTPISNHISRGYSESNFWVKFKITNNTKINANYFIKFTETSISKISVYIIDNDGSYTTNYKMFYVYCFGILSALIFYNLMIFVYSKDRSYLIYVIYSSLFLFWHVLINNFFPNNLINNPKYFYLYYQHLL